MQTGQGRHVPQARGGREREGGDIFPTTHHGLCDIVRSACFQHFNTHATTFQVIISNFSPLVYLLEHSAWELSSLVFCLHMTGYSEREFSRRDELYEGWVETLK